MHEKRSRFILRLKDERGVVAIIVGLSIVMFVGFAALAIDIGHLYGVRNELQNAADAGALAGARFLYTEDGTAVNAGANQLAYEAATANMSEKNAVEVNEGDVQRGHWSFSTRTFIPNNSLDPVNLWGKSTDDLDMDPNFINAIKVTARRESIPASAFFAGIFGYTGFTKQAEAIAYIGFAGTLQPNEVDQPIAICKESLRLGDEYQCSIGRMINSGPDITTSETGGWTNFNQDDPCQGGTNANEVKELVCGGGNPEVIEYGKDMATNGGEIKSAFNNLIACWENVTNKENVWNLTLPVVTCPGNNVGTCEEMVGAVNINIIWITDKEDYKDAPKKMTTENGVWSSDDPVGETRWASFVAYFNLQNVDGSPAPYAKKSIYFLPDCEPHIPAGLTGGENFGVLAKIPVLVK